MKSHSALLSGHRGKDVTAKAIRTKFFWPAMTNDIAEFVDKCLHCVGNRKGQTIPRPLGQIIHCERRGDVIHMDFLQMHSQRKRRDSAKETKYLLVFKDDVSHFCGLYPCKEPNGNVVVDALIDWVSTYNCVPKVIVCDGGSHFDNGLVKECTQRLGTDLHIVVAYSPQANGSVENLNNQLIKTARALLSSLHMDVKDWLLVLPIIRMILNNVSHP